jgi:hypothetical protein
VSFLPDLHSIEKHGRELKLPIDDILDATVACWSALRLASGQGRSLLPSLATDRTGLTIAIWV